MTKNIKNLSFFVLISVLLGLYPLVSMEIVDIRSITPIKNNMSVEQAREAVRDFLKMEVFKMNEEQKLEHIVFPTEIVRQEKVTNPRYFELITLQDGTQWVKGSGGLERFIGARYLDKAINFNNLNNEWRAVETKFYWMDSDQPIKMKVKSHFLGLGNLFLIDSDNFITFSKYAGTQKPELFVTPQLLGTSQFKNITGYRDTIGCVNFRVQPGDSKVTVIDTEYNSFSSEGKGEQITEDQKGRLDGQVFTFTLEEIFNGPNRGFVGESN